VSWPIVPRILPVLLRDEDREQARRVMEAMRTMTKLDIAALRRAAEG
jgi:predicted 3-demethylubiquinone-9 3-methyltransferase (glyoxalase superfamily)